MKPKLTYFDFPGSRGEECRLALFIAGVDFDDNRVKPQDWPALKPTTPYGAMPVYEAPGKPALAHSNAILALIGREHRLHPADPYEAARHEGMMAFVEEMRHTVGPTLRMQDAEKKAVREKLVAEYFPQWGAFAEKNIIHEPFFGGARLNVVDLKIHLIVRWFNTGKVDYIPANVFEAFPKLTRIHDAVRDHDRVKAWYARS